jgi:acyl dehydratase
MTDTPITLEDLKQKVGQPWLKLRYDVERSMVRKYAEATGDANPRWQKEAPPTLLATLGFECAISALLGLNSVVLHGSTDLEIAGPVNIGDTMTGSQHRGAARAPDTRRSYGFYHPAKRLHQPAR